MLRLITTISFNANLAKIYKDTDWQEYRTKYYQNGNYLTDCDSFADTKQEAIETANYLVNNYH